MVVDARHIIAAIGIGLGATLVMDLWNLSLKRAFGVPSLNYCMLGRWLRHMPAGTFRHSNINAAKHQPGECAIGWMAHYSIGVVLALVFVVITVDWLARPTLLPALLYGIVTVAFPFFIMQPALGLGVASSRAQRPMQARLKSIATHTIFGIGLYMCGLGTSYLLRAGT